MTGTIVPIMYNACKAAVTKIIENNHHISLTTDAWKSFSKHSYITITCHLIDDDGVLHNFISDTSEIHGLQPYWVVAPPPEQNATALFGCVIMSH